MLKRIKAGWIRPGLILLGIVGILLTACGGSAGTHSADANPALLFADGYMRAANLSTN